MTTCPPESRTFACKPDFDECMARIYAWYGQRIVDRPPVRFHHHNVEYERQRAVQGPWKTAKARGQLSVTWMNLPSYATLNVLACDFAVNISREHFDEFCMPILRREAELFAHNVFHMDGPGVAKDIGSILTLPNLAAMQWAQGIGKNQPILQWVPLIQKIQQAGKSVIVDLQMGELDEFMRRVDPRGIMIWIPAEPKDQRAVLERIHRW